ncbi:MAG TPA: hypothetical protein VE594_00060 [Nitrososphaeraceae archaeon]|nr:hypothetical protein [Nitrososphaeraceae archaeon]
MSFISGKDIQIIMPDPITDKDELLPPLSFRRGLVFGTVLVYC